MTFVSTADFDQENGDIEKPTARQQRVDTLKKQVQSAFTHEVAHSVFYRLGNAPAAGADSPRERTRDRWWVEPNSRPPCNCDDWFDCNPIWPSVECRKVACVIVPHNCGFVLLEACTGMC